MLGRRNRCITTRVRDGALARPVKAEARTVGDGYAVCLSLVCLEAPRCNHRQVLGDKETRQRNYGTGGLGNANNTLQSAS